jgi:tetratricopeptide (TPR) repeat protein
MALSSTAARAEPAEDLQAEGEQAAKAGNYAEAIDKFKAADRLEPRAIHACLISLAYTRRNLWPQAEIFRDKCHVIATAIGEQLPEWSAAADDQIEKAIAKAVAAGTAAAVTIRVEPADAAVSAQLTVSSFAPDETFKPRAIHLPVGTHQVFATSPGYESSSQLVDVKDSTPREVVIVLHRPQPVTAAPLPPLPARRLPWILAGAGVGLAAVGGVLDATWYRDARNAFAADISSTSLDRTWKTDRNVVYGFYIAGGLAFATAIAVRYWADHRHEHAPTLSVDVHGGAGVVSIGWGR